jgi:ribose transport system substrate-binding protein
MLTLDIPFHCELKAGVERAAREAGLGLVVADSHYRASDQATQIAGHAAAADVDALLVTPCDPVGIGEAIEQANHARLPVFTVDIASASGRGQVVTHVGSDNVEGGRMAARLLVEALGGRGTVLIVMNPGIASMLDRIRGFREVVGASRGILVIGEIPVFGKAREESAARIGERIGRAAVNGIFCCNDEFAMGAVAAVEAGGRLGEVAIVGFDGTEEARQAVQAGKMRADVVQQPGRMAELAVFAIRDHLAGKPVPSRIDAELTTCTAAAG